MDTSKYNISIKNLRSFNAFCFCKRIDKIQKKNRNVYLITSDLGYRAFEEFAKLFPKKFINVGVSENNMIGIAAGMAANGKSFCLFNFTFCCF